MPSKSEIKEEQNKLRAEVQKLFNQVKSSLKPRTAFDYQYEITNNYKKNVLTKLYNTFEKLIGQPKGVKLTKQKAQELPS